MVENRSGLNVRAFGDASLPAAICLPAFGDDSGVYEPLVRTALVERFRLVLTELPGFGGAEPLREPTTLEALSAYVADLARRENATILISHSVASITASLAARRAPDVIETIVSLEGNLTPADAYHSGTAADFDDADAFKAAFLKRLDEARPTDAGIARFRKAVERADAGALWLLGCDARAFSRDHEPGAVLLERARVVYLYDEANTPPQTLAWIAAHEIDAHRLEGVSHWMACEQPGPTAAAILAAFDRLPAKG